MAPQAPTGMLVEAPARERGSAAWLRRRLNALAAVLVEAPGPGERKQSGSAVAWSARRRPRRSVGPRKKKRKPPSTARTTLEKLQSLKP